MFKKTLLILSIFSLTALFSFAQDFTQYEDSDLPTTQYTPTYQENNNNQQEIGQNYLQTTSVTTNNQNNTSSLNDIKKYCPYKFTKTLKQGDRSNEVKILQSILNSDGRTVIATGGPGSPNNETTLYGAATKEAVKRFQALFISPELGDYAIPVANGIVGPKTIIFLNAICNDERFYNGQAQAQSVVGGPVSTAVSGGAVITNNSNASAGQIQTQTISTNNSNNNTNTTTTSQNNTTPACNNQPLKVALQAFTRSVRCDADSQACESFKVILSGSDSLSPIEAGVIKIDGDANVGEIRKLAKAQYSVMITPTGKTKTVGVQVASEDASSSCGIKNELASNLVVVATNVANSTTSTNTNTTAGNNSSTSEMIAALNSQLNSTLAQLTNSGTASNSPQVQQLQQEKADLQKQINDLKNQQNQQNCYQGSYGTVCQNPQQQQAQQQQAQNDALMKALGGMLAQNKNGQQGSGQQPGQSGGGNNGGGQSAAQQTATAAEKQATAICSQKGESSDECKQARNTAAAAKTEAEKNNDGENPQYGTVIKKNSCTSYKIDSGNCIKNTTYSVYQMVSKNNIQFVMMYNIEEKKDKANQPKEKQCSVAVFESKAKSIECFTDPKCTIRETVINTQGPVFTIKKETQTKFAESKDCPNSNTKTNPQTTNSIRSLNGLPTGIPGIILNN
jgi:hypothetical protein